MRHPDDGGIPRGEALEEIGPVVDTQLRATVFAMKRTTDAPAAEVCHQLHPIANAEDRNPLLE